MSDPSILVIGARIPEGLGAWATGNGYTVHHAGRASDGLERFDKVPTSLVLVQLRLEQLADLAYVARLRELPAGRTVPIVALCRSVELDRCKQFASALRLNLWLPEPLDTIALAPWASPLIHSTSGTFTRRRSGVLGEVEFTGRSPSSDAIPREARPPSSDANPVPPRPSRTASSDSLPMPPRSSVLATSDEPGAPRARDSRSTARSGPSPTSEVQSGPPPAVTTAAWPTEPTSSSKSTPPGLRPPPSLVDEAPAPRVTAAPPKPPPVPVKEPAPPEAAPPAQPSAPAQASAPSATTGRPELVETKTVPEYVVPSFDEVDSLFADD
jgi:hypothetical protein